MTNAISRKSGRRGSPESWSVDAHVGQRVRMRRSLLGLSQEKLGDAIGLTFQQIQKYERGANRISAGTLYRLGRALDVPVSFFFDGYDVRGETPASAPAAAAETSDVSRREARLLRMWRCAPESVASEVLALLMSLNGEGAPRNLGAPMNVGSAAPPFGADPADGKKQTRRRRSAAWDPADILDADPE